jgi:RHS repeat-associated protein
VPEIDTTATSSGTSRSIADGSAGQALDLTDSDGSTCAYLNDDTGSPISILTDTGTAAFRTGYDPYGAESASPGTGSGFYQQNPAGYGTGQSSITTSAAGLVHCGARWNLTAVGGWTQEDTLDTPLDPANANRYAYAGDDPINGTDPAGAYVCGGTQEDGVCEGDAYNAADAYSAAALTCDAEGLYALGDLIPWSIQAQRH